MADINSVTPKQLMAWLAQNDAPNDILIAAERAILDAEHNSIFNILLADLLDHPAADDPAILDFSSQDPNEVKAAKAIVTRILMNPRLRVVRA